MAIRISLRQGITESSTSGEYRKVYTNLPEVVPPCRLQGGARFMVPNDTEKTALFPRGGNAATEDYP